MYKGVLTLSFVINIFFPWDGTFHIILSWISNNLSESLMQYIVG